jgi:hypothetical protein
MVRMVLAAVHHFRERAWLLLVLCLAGIKLQPDVSYTTPMDEKTRSSLARIAVKWQKGAASRVGEESDEAVTRPAANESAGMSPIALRHRRYAQLIQFRRKAV